MHIPTGVCVFNNCELCMCMCLCGVMEVVVTNETRYCGFNTFFIALLPSVCVAV